MSRPSPLLPPDDALRLVLAGLEPLAPEELAAEDACGRVLARALAAREDSPAFDHSAMDGYAVRAADAAGARRESPRTLALVPGSRAGGAAAEVGPGRSARVFTGAPLPPGADAVVMQELAERDGDASVRVLHAPEPGLHVRRRGEDVRAGDPLLRAGAVIRPVEVGLLAAQGIAAVSVIRRPRVAVLVTGDELARPAPGSAVRDANGPALAAACARWGALVRRLPPAADDRAELASAMRDALGRADVLLVTGGVSVGDFDLTRPALEDLGAEIPFAGVAIKPGKPLLFARLGGKPVFGLPGNPVAALVCAEEFVRPALERMSGRAEAARSLHVEGEAAAQYPLRDARRHYLYCRASFEDGRWSLDILRPQGSARLAMASGANALAAAEGGPRSVRAGERLWFRWLK